MHCISNFLESMAHEMPDFSDVTISKTGYKVDGNGIKYFCKYNNLKSIDYYSVDSKRGFLYVEFSDLIKQDAQIQTKIQSVTDSDLSKGMKKELRKGYYKTINQELVQKFKDSNTILSRLSSKLKNIPDEFNNLSTYVIVVAPVELNDPKRIDKVKFLDTLKDKLTNALPSGMHSGVKVITLTQFIS